MNVQNYWFCWQVHGYFLAHKWRRKAVKFEAVLLRVKNNLTQPLPCWHAFGAVCH
jgi:hypothetical protein